MISDNLSQWRSPPPILETPLLEASSLPADSHLNPLSPPTIKQEIDARGLIPPCEHGESDGDMHSHAFDLLSLSGPSPHVDASSSPIPSSVPATSVLSATRPAGITGVPAKPRRMSSSTTGVLGRGKLGATGEQGHGNPSNGRSASNHTPNHSASYVPSRRSGPSSSPAPQLFDFAKTDRRPSHSGSRPVGNGQRSISSTLVAASLPNGSALLAQAQSSSKSALRAQALAQNGALGANAVDGDLDMSFEDEEDDELGSLDLEMDLDVEDLTPEEIKKLALGSGSGGVKGRRKGMVFKCENCGKEYRHPSCLIKHRWEHSPHWQEPTQVSMSKHQQVQMLEAAAILAHLDPAQGRSLPTDKSLWPAILSPLMGEAQLRRSSVSAEASRDPSAVRSPQSTAAPLTPSSLRDASTMGTMQKPRKSSPGSDSTTSSDGFSQQPNGHGYSRPVGINSRPPAYPHTTSSLSSSVPGPGTPQSVGSLPSDLAGLHFYPQGTPSSLSILGSGISPIPNRGVPLSLKSRGGVGGGMFGPINTAMPSSSVRSGAVADDEAEDESGRDDGSSPRGRGKSSSEEVEERRKARKGEEEWGMAMEMEL